MVLASVDPVAGQVLVQAAAEVSLVFRERDREILRLRIRFSEEVEQYELLNILDFTSARKRMSVVLRKLNTENIC